MEELEDASKLYHKFAERYNVDKATKHDELNAKMFAILRHSFEPNFDLKEVVEALNPGYSRLRTFSIGISNDQIGEIVDEYFQGIKEIVFVPSRNDLVNIVSLTDDERAWYLSKLTVVNDANIRQTISEAIWL